MNDWFSDDQATFGDRLANAREAAGLTQTQFAERLGVSEKTVQSWEHDRSEPRANRMQMIAGLLNVSLMWLMSGRGEGLAPPGTEDAGAAPDIAGALADLARMRADLNRLSGQIGAVERRLRRAGAA